MKRIKIYNEENFNYDIITIQLKDQMIEDDFYATIKFKSGEEIFAKVAASEEVNRTVLLVSNPIMVSEVKSKNGMTGYKVEPWFKNQ